MHTAPDDTQQTQKSRVVGALLVHGLNGCRDDMIELTEALASHGMVTENILLPGHGTHVRDMFTPGWPEWTAAVHSELQALKQRCDVVFLIGHSLGGALCLYTAAHEEVAGIVALCAPLYMQWWMLPAVSFIKRITPALPTVHVDICDPVARSRYERPVYSWTPMAPVESMLLNLPTLRSELPKVKAPALIIVAKRDHVVPARNGREIYRLLGSQEKHLVTLHRSYHVVMKDYDREEVLARTLAFVEQYASKPHPYEGTAPTIDQSA
jgi:carboxylesterase